MRSPFFTVGVAAGPSVQLLGCHCGGMCQGLSREEILGGSVSLCSCEERRTYQDISCSDTGVEQNELGSKMPTL